MTHRTFKYQCVGALTTVMVVENVRVLRVYHSMCHLEPISEGFEPSEFYLLQILMTLCHEARSDFLVYDRNKKSFEIHQRRLPFTCRPEVEISKELYEELKAERNAELQRRSMFYNDKKGKNAIIFSYLSN